MEPLHDILELILQRPPMVMVDCLVSCDPVVTVTQFEVKPDGIMVEEGLLMECGLIENIAQTCAVRVGYLNRHSGQPVRVGVIGALRDMAIHCQPTVGTTVETTIEVTDEVFGMTLANARSQASDGRMLAEGTIKIALI